MNFVRKQQPADPAATSVHLGAAGCKYFVPSAKHVATTEADSLAKLAQASDLLSHLLADPPADVQTWHDKLQAWQTGVLLIKPHGFSDQSDYRIPLTFRLWCIAQMRNAGIQALWAPRDYKMADFANVFPDMNSWLTKLSSTRPGVTLWEVMHVLGYTGPPELLSMYLCFTGDESVYAYKLPWIRQAMPQLKAQALTYFQQHGQNAHIAVLLKLVAQQALSSGSTAAGLAGADNADTLPTQDYER